MPELILRRPFVQRCTGLSRSAIYDLMSKGKFPKPIQIGMRAVGWPEGEIVAWLEARKAERDS